MGRRATGRGGLQKLEARGGIVLQSLWREPALLTPSFSTSALQSCKNKTSLFRAIDSGLTYQCSHRKLQGPRPQTLLTPHPPGPHQPRPSPLLEPSRPPEPTRALSFVTCPPAHPGGSSQPPCGPLCSHSCPQGGPLPCVGSGSSLLRARRQLPGEEEEGEPPPPPAPGPLRTPALTRCTCPRGRGGAQGQIPPGQSLEGPGGGGVRDTAPGRCNHRLGVASERLEQKHRADESSHDFLCFVMKSFLQRGALCGASWAQEPGSDLR